MSAFVKFPSITNHYQAKFIQKTLEFHPGLKDETYIVTEKLHGANLQVYFEPGKLYRVGSRNRFLEPHSKFYNVWGALIRIGHVLSEGKHWAYRNQKSLRLFGELYGGNIQQDINYGPEQNIRFFAAMIDDQLIAPGTLLSLEIASLRQNFVPIIGLAMTWEGAMNCDIDRCSLLTPTDHEGPNLIEGVVIQPFRQVYTMPSGASLLIKKKNPEFLARKKKKSYTPMESAIVELHTDFLGYVTEARIDSIISQEGPFTEFLQLGTYIRLVLADARADFHVDHIEDLQFMDKKTLKYIYNVGGTIANMLKARL